MPRRPRIPLPDHLQHNRGACFFAEEEYQFYLHWL